MIEYTDAQIRVNRLIWEDAIASGDYKKGKHRLCLDNKYCCLGVAAELFAEENDIKVTTYITGDNEKMKKFGNAFAYSSAPEYVINALGLYNNLGRDKNHRGLETLTTINDNNDTFDPVIKAIETGDYYKPLSS